MRGLFLLAFMLGYALPSFAGIIDGRVRNSFIGGIAVVPRVGVFIPSDTRVDPAIAAGGEARIQLYSIDEGLSVAAGLMYMAPSRPGSAQVVVVPMDLNVVYEVFVEGMSTELFISGGVGLYSWSASSHGRDDAGASFGFQAGIGVEPLIGPGNLLGFIGYSLASAQHPSLGSIDLGGFAIEIGYRIIF